MANRGGSRRRLLPLVLLTVVTAAGCAAVPTGGAVLSGKAVDHTDPLSEPYIRPIASAPLPGWGPQDIVRGFLAASASFEGGHAMARQYLTPEWRRQWQPDSGLVRVYDDKDRRLDVGDPEPGDAGDMTVSVAGVQTATIDESGQYTAENDQPLTAVFRLRKVAGQWRISSGPAGLLLSSRDVERTYRPLNLYFFDPTGDNLVPDPVFMPVQERADLATTLVARLLRGPTPWLAPAVRTSFPSGTRLRGPAVVSTGTVVVDLSGQAAAARPSDLAAMSAQLMWTLRQLPEIQQMRVQVAGRTVQVPGVDGDGTLQSRRDWRQQDPSGFDGVGGPSVPAYFVNSGHLWRLEGSQAGGRLPGPLGAAGRVPVSHPAISYDGRWAAGLITGARGLVVADLGPNGHVAAQVAGTALTPPSWDPYGNLWFADSGGGGSAVWLLPSGDFTRRTRVLAPELSTLDVRALRVARDGCRIAVVARHGAQSQILLGRIRRDGQEIWAEAFRPLGTQLSQVADLAWADADRLVVLGRSQEPGTAFQPYFVPVNGTGVQALGPAGDLRTIAAAPGAPLLAGVAEASTGRGEVWEFGEGGTWKAVAAGGDPAYPG